MRGCPAHQRYFPGSSGHRNCEGTQQRSKRGATVCGQDHIERVSSTSSLYTDKEDTEKFCVVKQGGSHNTDLLGQRLSLQFADETSRKA